MENHTNSAAISRRSLWTSWIIILVVFVVLVLLPVSNTVTRYGSVGTLLAGWGVFVAICWRKKWLRNLMFVPPAFALLLLVLPARAERRPERLRQDFVAGLRRYAGVHYFWGGEGFTGIDCSGLVRRGLIDAMFMRGIRSADPGLLRSAALLWWHDCSASDLGDAQHDLTVSVLETPSLNALDHSRIVLGDLAVTKGGEHVMAYVGENCWIEADPLAHRVIYVTAPSKTNAWFHGPMRVVRWRVLAD
jgi:hypothetical protein